MGALAKKSADVKVIQSWNKVSTLKDPSNIHQQTPIELKPEEVLNSNLSPGVYQYSHKSGIAFHTSKSPQPHIIIIYNTQTPCHNL